MIIDFVEESVKEFWDYMLVDYFVYEEKIKLFVEIGFCEVYVEFIK